jgi:hypothetical protein
MELIKKPLTEKQKKFVEIYCSSKGLLSNQECAIEAGYSKDSAYARAHELLNPKICPHVVKYVHEIEQEYKTKYQITKDSHMAELWRIREESKKKNRPLVWLRAEELRGKLMGYYVDKKQTLNVNKSLNDLSEEELEKRMNDIHSQYSHFIDLEEPEKKIINAEIQGDRKAEKYKTAFELARKMLNKNGLTIGDPESEIVEDIKRLNKIREDSIETPEQKKIQKDLEDYQKSQKKVREKNKSTKEKIEW